MDVELDRLDYGGARGEVRPSHHGVAGIQGFHRSIDDTILALARDGGGFVLLGGVIDAVHRNGEVDGGFG